jgi:hypothetical protein
MPSELLWQNYKLSELQVTDQSRENWKPVVTGYKKREKAL